MGQWAKYVYVLPSANLTVVSMGQSKGTSLDCEGSYNDGYTLSLIWRVMEEAMGVGPKGMPSAAEVQESQSSSSKHERPRTAGFVAGSSSNRRELTRASIKAAKAAHEANARALAESGEEGPIGGCCTCVCPPGQVCARVCVCVPVCACLRLSATVCLTVCLPADAGLRPRVRCPAEHCQETPFHPRQRPLPKRSACDVPAGDRLVPLHRGGAAVRAHSGRPENMRLQRARVLRVRDGAGLEAACDSRLQNAAEQHVGRMRLDQRALPLHALLPGDQPDCSWRRSVICSRNGTY